MVIHEGGVVWGAVLVARRAGGIGRGEAGDDLGEGVGEDVVVEIQGVEAVEAFRGQGFGVARVSVVADAVRDGADGVAAQCGDAGGGLGAEAGEHDVAADGAGGAVKRCSESGELLDGGVLGLLGDAPGDDGAVVDQLVEDVAVALGLLGGLVWWGEGGVARDVAHVFAPGERL